MKNKAVFIDRDGTINVDGPYLSDPDRFQMYPGVGKGVKRLRDAGFKIIVITNQSGIARGYFTEDDLAAVHKRMKEEFARFDVTLDGIYYCPHHPDDNCSCRKPKTGLFEAAIAEHDIDPARSYMIGDKPLDVAAGRRIGTVTVLVDGSRAEEESLREASASEFGPNYSSNGFTAAVDYVMRRTHGK